MKKKAIGKPIPQKFFSSYLSSQRLRNIQSLLKPCGEGDDKRPEAILAVLGIDSRYNEGCRSLANYLFFGFFTLRQNELENAGVEDEDIEDVVICVTYDMVHIYCNMILYDYLLPYMAHWRNIRVHCLNINKEDERDRDQEEEFKIQSFVSMVEEYKFIGISQSKTTQGKNNIAIEKWPLIQSYAAEGSGKGVFFTIKHEIVNFNDQLTKIYNKCDPVVLEKLMSTSAILFKRHWMEAIEIIDASDRREKLATLTEGQILEPMISYYNHGRLMANRNKPTKPVDTATPYVLFGARTQEFSKNPSPKDKFTITQETSTHMIFHCKDPKGPLACTRTYFVKHSNANTEMKRKSEELCKIYKHCVEASRIAVEVFSKSLNPALASAEATTHLLKVGSTLTFKPDCAIESYDKQGRRLLQTESSRTGHVNIVRVSATDICDSKQCVGAVVFADTFAVSSISVVKDGESEQSDSLYYVVTSSLPRHLQWTITKNSSSPRMTEQSNDNLISFAAQCWSNSSLFTEPIKVSMTISTSGNISISGERCETIELDKNDGLYYYDGLAPGKVGVLLIDFSKSLNTSWKSVPLQLQSKLKILESDQVQTRQCMILFITPGEPAHKLFYAEVLHSPSIPVKILVVESPSAELVEVQKNLNFNSGSMQYEENIKRKDFMKHCNVSAVVSGCKLSPSSVNILLNNDAGKEEVMDKEKVCVTILLGLPCSRAMELCNSLVSVNKEHVRWVVVKAKSRTMEDCGVLDTVDLENQLTQAVGKKKVSRPSAAARKKLRIVLLAVGFFEASAIVRSVIHHNDQTIRDQMFVGAVTTCIWPRSFMLNNHMTVPRLMEQCTVGFVNNVVFNVSQSLANKAKDSVLMSAQHLIRRINPKAAIIISVEGNLSHQNDFVFILNETTFNSNQATYDRELTLPHIDQLRPSQLYPNITSVTLDFSQPLMRGPLSAHLRSLKLKLSPPPYTGNVYFITGCLAFTDEPAQLYDLTYSSLDGDVELIPRISAVQMPAPPPQKDKKIEKPRLNMTFYGVNLDRTKLMNWLRETGRQQPSKKCAKTKSHLTSNELNSIREQYRNEPLPEGYFYNGTQYVNMMDNLKTYDHPCMPSFIEKYLKEKNKEIDAYNAKIAADGFVDMFV